MSRVNRVSSISRCNDHISVNMMLIGCGFGLHVTLSAFWTSHGRPHPIVAQLSVFSISVTNIIIIEPPFSNNSHTLLECMLSAMKRPGRNKAVWSCRASELAPVWRVSSWECLCACIRAQLLLGRDKVRQCVCFWSMFVSDVSPHFS